MYKPFISMMFILGLAACASGSARVDDIPPEADFSAEITPDVDTTEPELAEPPQAPTLAEDTPKGVLGIFRRNRNKDVETTVLANPAEPTLDETTVIPMEIQPELIIDDTLDASDETVEIVSETGDAPIVPSMTDEEIAAAGKPESGETVVSTRPRLLGFLRKKVPGDTSPITAAAPADDVEEPRIEPSMTDEEIAAAGLPPAEPAAEPRLRGPRWLGGGRRNAPRAPEQPNFDRPLGVLPFGELVANCNVKKRDLGTEVARAHGTAKYRLYDTDPSSTIPRTQYITGFKDGCARQFTASLALFGSPLVHEATRYNPNNSTPYSELDRAYEKAKRKICGVGKGKACPESKIDKLARETAFVSVYRNFGGGTWVEAFLHKGQLVSYQTRTP